MRGCVRRARRHLLAFGCQSRDEMEMLFTFLAERYERAQRDLQRSGSPGALTPRWSRETGEASMSF